MGAGLIQYRLGAGKLSRVGSPPVRQEIAGKQKGLLSPAYTVVIIALLAVVAYLVYLQGIAWLMPLLIAVALVAVVLIGLDAKLTSQEWTRMGLIFILFFFSSIFFMAFEQAGSSLNLFARDLTNNSIAGKGFAYENYQAVNSLFIVGFAPVFAALWIKLGQRQPSESVKFAFGLLFAGLGFLVMTYASSLTGGGARVSPFWLVLFYLLATFGELCLSPVGLSSMTKLAPRQMVGLMMGVWFLSISLGNFFAGIIGGEFEAKSEVLVGLFSKVAAVTIIAAIALFALSPFFKRLMLSGEQAER